MLHKFGKIFKKENPIKAKQTEIEIEIHDRSKGDAESDEETEFTTIILDDSPYVTSPKCNTYSLEDKYRYQQCLRDTMEQVLMRLNAKKIADMKIELSEELHTLFYSLIRIFLNSNTISYNWYSFEKYVLRSGNVRRFVERMFKADFSTINKSDVELLLKLKANKWYRQLAHNDKNGYQIQAILNYLDLFELAITNHFEIQSLVEKINEVKLEDLPMEDQLTIQRKTEEIAKKFKMIEDVKVSMVTELQGIDHTKVAKMNYHEQLSKLFEPLYKIFYETDFDLSDFYYYQVKKDKLEEFKTKLGKVDFATLSVPKFKSLIKYKNSTFNKKFAQNDENGQPIVKILKFMELIEYGVGIQTQVNTLKQEIRTLKEDWLYLREELKKI